MTDERDEFDEPVRIGNLLWLPDEHTFEDLDPVGTWQRELERARHRGDTAEVERRLKTGPPLGYGPAPSTFAPVVLAIEVGGDPGATIALALSAKRDARLALVIVTGGPNAARFARHLLDLAGRPEVAVVESAAPSTPDLSIARLIPADVPRPPTDVRSAVSTVTGLDPYLVIWGNSGPLHDLAEALRHDPALADRLQTHIAAGPWDGDLPPFASDGPSAAFALAAIHTPRREAHHPESAVSPPFPPDLLTAEPAQLRTGPDSELRQRLSAPDAPAWAALLGGHLDIWFAQGRPSASLYPALLIGSMLGAPLTETDVRRVKADDTGRIHVDPDGVEMEVTVGLADYFITVADWADNQIREAIAAG